jgi:hypothetical protein
MQAATYTKYLEAIGRSMFYPMIAFYMLQIGCDLFANTTLAAWAESSRYQARGNDESIYNKADNFYHYNFATRDFTPGHFTALFGCLSLISVVSGLACNLLGFRGAVHASRSLHHYYTHHTLYSLHTVLTIHYAGPCTTILIQYTHTLYSCRSLHHELVDKLIHAPMYFFDMTPLGR